ncbi:leucine-rich repeat-containing protein 36 isoform X2 [Microtus ochrogaster]|uniref:Leucine-rich repeat-containing protein 36 isoform X2 n=1 Tax=Microtus ochrogaster TaxID=79684 RepID=A0ABM0KFP7_MICOH|nr:leucine-rich repeat-containing protein 36 isoform X2 [Microtus ochrogaster]
MAEQWDLDEEGLRRLGALTLEQSELVESLSLQGSYAGKIHSIGDAFRNFKNLRSLDLSRNLITSLKGIQYLCSLQDLNLYYNNIPSLVEVSRLQPLPYLKELDLRLNPVVRKDTDYRLFAVYTLQTLEKLDDRAVRDSERKAAKLHFSQLGNRENFLLEVEKSSREKTVKNCVTDEGCASKVNPEIDTRIETDSNKGLFIPLPSREIKDSITSTSASQASGTPAQKLDVCPLGTQLQEATRRETSDTHKEDEFRHYLPHQSTVRSPEKMTRDGYRVSFLDTKSSGSSPEKDLIPRPDTSPCIHDGSLGKRLDVGDSNQILPYQLPSDVSLDCYDNHYSQTLSLHGSLVKKPQKIKNYRECSIKPSNDIKATSSHSCGDLLTSLSNPDSSTGRLLKLSSDLYATTHFNSDPALLANVEQQLSSSLRDFAPAPGSFPGNRVLGNSLRTLLLPSGAPENREIPTQRSLSGGFKRKDNVLANLNLKCGFQEATSSEAQPLSSDLGSLHGLPGNHSPPISARTPHVATVLRQLLELVDKHWNGSGSLLLNKKFLGPARDLLLSLVVPAPPQQCRSHLEDKAGKAFRWRESELKEVEQLVPNDAENLKQKLVKVLEENMILSEKIQQLERGAAASVVSGHPSHSHDDLLRRNQQLTLQVACLNQELTQLKRLEETVALLHESQRSLVVTNEYLLQQLSKEQKGYSGKSLLPPEKSHPLGRSSPFGKSTLSSSSPMAHDTGQYLIQSVSEAAPEPSLWS